MSHSSAPRVTVLMAVHNGAAYVAQAAESILAQTWRDFEFLILDDASTDETAAILGQFRDPRLRLLRNERNLGLTVSLNRGLREARGDLVARQDADDLSEPERLARQVAFLEAHPGVALVGSQGWSIGARGGVEGRLDVPLEPAGLRWASLFLNPIVHTAGTFRRSVFLGELGGYDEAFVCCQDYELWTRAASRFALQNLPQRLVRRRVHGGSISSTRQESAARLVRQVVTRLLPQVAPGEHFTPEEISILSRLRTGIEPAEVPSLEGLLHRLRPPHTADADFRRSIAWVYAYLGYTLLPRSASSGLRELWSAVRICPRYGLALPWVKILALALLGEKAREAVRRFQGG